MTEDQLRERLGTTVLVALLHSTAQPNSGALATEVANALLPVARAYADQRAADALREAADMLSDWQFSACDPRDALRARADALAGNDG